MHAVTYNGINEFIVEISKLLLKNGEKRSVRGKVCYELPEPIMIKITSPSSRVVLLKERKWNTVLPYAESLWIASGRNDLSMMASYLVRLHDFSDDGEYLRGAYGPRVRSYSGNRTHYRQKRFVGNKTSNSPVDQLKFISECFARDQNTRQAVISLVDPVKDYFNDSQLLTTKDFPCTLNLHFIKNTNEKLDLRTTMRSNDFLWGASGVNIFNYTFMLEYMSAITQIPMGNYYHIVNNMHYYEEHRERLEVYSSLDFEDPPHVYRKRFTSYSEFMQKINTLSTWEQKLRKGRISSPLELEDEFFNDWSAVLYRYHTGKFQEFINPSLRRICR
jgi:thymidylate synthase